MPVVLSATCSQQLELRVRPNRYVLYSCLSYSPLRDMDERLEGLLPHLSACQLRIAEAHEIQFSKPHALAGNGLLGAVQRLFNREPQQQQVAANAPHVGYAPSLTYSPGSADTDTIPNTSSVRSQGDLVGNKAADAAWEKGAGESYQSTSLVDRIRVNFKGNPGP